MPACNEGVMEPDKLLTTLLTHRRPRENVRQQPLGPHMWLHALPLVATRSPDGARASRHRTAHGMCSRWQERPAGASSAAASHARTPRARARAARAYTRSGSPEMNIW